MASVFDQIAFRGYSRGVIKKLPGFAKHYRLPAGVGSRATAFVRRIGGDLVEQRSQELFRQLRDAFGYRRRELSVSQEPGLADLLTPDFTVHLGLDVDSEDSRRYELTVEVDQITQPEALHTRAFSQVFEGEFDRVVCVVKERISIEDVIDRVEDHADPDAVSVDFPPDAERCVVSLTGRRTQLHFDPSAVTLLARPRTTIAELLEAGQMLSELLGIGPEALFATSRLAGEQEQS